MSARGRFARLIAYLSHKLMSVGGHGEFAEHSPLDGLIQGYVDETGVLRPLL